VLGGGDGVISNLAPLLSLPLRHRMRCGRIVKLTATFRLRSGHAAGVDVCRSAARNHFLAINCAL